MSSGIDLTSFHAIFFEECGENIEILEAELLKLDESSDLEVINTIFRAAHSIKGGGGTFGFAEISDFTHGMETILDEMRNGNLKVTTPIVELLLASLDCLREMIAQSKENKPYNSELIQALKQQHVAVEQTISRQESGDSSEHKPPQVADKPEKNMPVTSWGIKFYPDKGLFFTGNDPLRLIRELEALGEISIEVDTAQLPDYEQLDPQQCYLGWNIKLKGAIDEQQIDEVFAWVEGECDLDIYNETPLDTESDAVLKSLSNTAAQSGRRKADAPGVVGRDAKSIRVGVEKVDALMNLVGELVITRSILSRACEDLDSAQYENIFSSLEQLERNTRDLQEQTMSIRMLPIDFAYQRLPRIVHDLSLSLGKKVELKFSGENTELDKTVLEKIGDPLVHLVRNSLDHGIELPERRRQQGKSDTGLIAIDAYHQGGSIVIEISDDGAGLNYDKILEIARSKKLISDDADFSDAQLNQLIFLPGLSTSSTVSDVSGRGVGMDVVKKNIEDLGGAIEVTSSKGSGCRFKIRLPLTLAILDGQMIRVQEQTFIIPMQSIIESIQIQKKSLYVVDTESEVYHYRGNYIPVIRLQKVLGVTAAIHVDKEDVNEHYSSGFMVIIDVNGERAGLCVDDVIGQQQVVIKSLENNYRHVAGIAGATVLGDGSVALIIDVYDVAKHSMSDKKLNRMMSADLASKPAPLH